MRKLIARLIFWCLIRPIGKIIDFIYPEGTQKRILAWLDPDDNTKIRFQLVEIDGIPDYELSSGIKIDDFLEMVRKIEAQLIWRNKK